MASCWIIAGMKRHQVTFTFPQALAKHAIQIVTINASTWSAAISRGLREVMKRPGIKGCRHTVIKIIGVSSSLTETADE